jgi:hypothetical protein
MDSQGVVDGRRSSPGVRERRRSSAARPVRGAHRLCPGRHLARRPRRGDARIRWPSRVSAAGHRHRGPRRTCERSRWPLWTSCGRDLEGGRGFGGSRWRGHGTQDAGPRKAAGRWRPAIDLRTGNAVYSAPRAGGSARSCGQVAGIWSGAAAGNGDWRLGRAWRFAGRRWGSRRKGRAERKRPQASRRAGRHWKWQPRHDRPVYHRWDRSGRDSVPGRHLHARTSRAAGERRQRRRRRGAGDA